MKKFSVLLLVWYFLITNDTISQINNDSINLILSTNTHDTNKINALLAWDDEIYEKDPKLDLELNQRVVSICERNLKDVLSRIEIIKYKKSLSKSFNNIGVNFIDQANFEKASEYFNSSLVIAEEFELKNQMAKVFINIGRCNYEKGNLNEALVYYNKCLELTEQENDNRTRSNCLSRIGILFYSIGNLEKALEYYYLGLKIRKEIGDENLLSYSYNNIGNVYSDQGNYEKSMQFHQKSVKLFQKLGLKGQIAGSYNNISLIHQNYGDIDKALDYLEKSLNINKDINSKKGIGSNYLNIGNIYYEKTNYEKALDYYEKARINFQQIKDQKRVARTYIGIGRTYKRLGDYKTALKKLLKAKELFLKINNLDGLHICYYNLNKVYEKLGKPQKALENYKLYVSVRDSLAQMNGIEKERQRQFNEQYLLDKQADSIKYANEIILHQAEAKTQKQRSNGLVLISIIILVSLALVFTQLKKVKKGKLLVEERNIVIEEKQKEITDSINYAKRLQDGILVPLDLVQSWLPESFIFFNPKDIVSGDFYWIEKVGDKIYFAVADCTGHGIPGALVSIICSNSLSKSLHEDKIFSPSKILDSTRKLVEKRFTRSVEMIKDGMDISLCSLDIKTKIITWSGAMNPLWIVRKGNKSIEEISPDRQAIGMVENPILFKEHKIKLKVGDSVYLFSDGYQDQFGGPKGKKYLRVKMKKFILSIQKQTMKEQLVSFEKEFNSWRGNQDQIDDVCVMGVKIT